MSSESLNLKIFGVDHAVENQAEWTHFEAEYKANAATSLVNLYLKDVQNKPVSTGTFWIDDFQIIPVSTSQSLPVYAQSLEVQMNVSRLAVNETAQAAVQVIPEEAEDQNVIWSSSNSKVATVDENGKVSAVGRGKTLITATSKPIR